MIENLFDDPDELAEWEEDDARYVEEIFQEVWEEGQILQGTKIG